MPIVIGGIAALVALAAGILGEIDPVTSLTRAGLAFAVGWFGTQVWYVFFTVRAQSLSEFAASVESEPEELKAA